MSGKKETNNMNKDIKIIIRDIYSDVFRQLKQQYIVVFYVEVEMAHTRNI